jgi:cysteine-S-conjugate beta-lyase
MAAMPYDFDSPLDRRGTSSLKWDSGRRLVGRDDLLPLWVADMDFRAPPEILEALSRRLAHGVFGYTVEPDSYFEAAASWLERRHGWRVRREWMLSSPGVIASLSAAILALTEPGDRVVVQPPVYYPFERRVHANGRQVLSNPLLRSAGGRYELDLEGLERSLDDRTRMLILCSPHNPVGRVWRREELEGLLAVCARRGVVVVSDEIHHDIVMPGHRHTPIAALSEVAAALTVTLTSVSKTFNLAGLGSSLAIAADPGVRAKLERAQAALWPGLPNAFSIAAAEAAWRDGERWLEELLAYIAANQAYLVARLGAELPGTRVSTLEGTYLSWIDMRGLGVDDEALTRRLRGKQGVWLDEGRKFGPGGEGFQRINLACPRAMLADGVDRMVRALRE